MESLPPRRIAQRRPSPEQASVNSSSPRRTGQTASSTQGQSEDAQTRFLTNSEPKQEQEEAQTEKEYGSPTDQPKDEDSEVKKCWICFADSTEDTPESSPWRDPCPCALVAHETCLLDWIADMESPTNRRTQQRGFGPPKIECPQCKKEIALARPRSFIVDAVRRIERAGIHLTTPGAVAVLFGLLYNGSMAWGVHTIYAVFGAQDGFRILQPLVLNTIRPRIDLDTSTGRDLGERLLGTAIDYLVHWRLYIGIPLITPIVILSRTTFADSVLPVLPVLFFATQSPSPQDTFDFGQWPPSASLAFAVLPYIRSAYNFYYQKAWAAKAQRWTNEIQPRVRDGETENAGTADPQPINGDAGEDENVVEVRIDGGLWEWDDGEDSGDENEQQLPIQFQGVRDDAAHVQGPQADPPPDIADDRNPQLQHLLDGQPNQNAANQPHNQRAADAAPRRLSFSPTDVAETFLGSLMFPTIAGLSGQLLKLILPRAWTMSPSVTSGGRVRIAAKGLLQEKWGRSLVGGCLFIVFKDFVSLYVKWKTAQLHRKRRVVDYQGKK